MLSGAQASESNDIRADCQSVSHKKHYNAMLFSLSLGVSNTQASVLARSKQLVCRWLRQLPGVWRACCAFHVAVPAGRMLAVAEL